jgi:3',5'-cyclic AMP phosphodiesterase CpdA
VVVSGDLTQRARHREYHAAAQFLRRMPAPVIAVPGNHDLPYHDPLERFTDPWGRWRRYVAPEVEPSWSDSEVAVVGLNTARRGGLYLNWARGRVGNTRLTRLEARLAAVPAGLFRIVVAHHPFAAPGASPGVRLVGGAGPALAAFARLDVGMVLSGHLHLPDISPAADLPGGSRLMLVQAATATSWRLRGAPNAWHRITVEGGVPSITSHTWDGSGWAQSTG